MTATFGRLDRARLEPGPGLNLIHAPNEGGKSTWAAFWRAMLYGIDTRDRDKKGYLADKNRYQPWSGAPMEGEITLDYEGRDITIRRGPRGNTPFGSFSAVYTGTQEPVPGLTGANCGELLTGVGQEVFTRSAFLGNGDLSVTTAPELERRIAALVSSGQEDVSFSQAMGRLKEWKNRRQVNRSVGEIPKLEAELARVREKLDCLEETAGQAAALDGERAALERRRDNLARDAETHKLLAQKKLSDRYARAEGEYDAARKHLADLEWDLEQRPIPDREEVKRAQGELQYIKVLEGELKQGSAALEEAQQAAEQAKAAARDDLFSELTGDEAVAKAGEISVAVQSSREKLDKLKRMSPKITAFGLILAALLGGGGWLLSRSVVFAAALALIICAGVLVNTCMTNFRARTAEKQIAAILSPFGVQTPEELTALAQNYRERCQAAEEAQRHWETVDAALADQKDRLETSRSELLDFVHQFAPEASDLFGCSAALSRALSMDHDLTLARERVEERRRRLEDLEAQGAKQEAEAPSGLTAPELGPEETAQALADAAARLEEVSARLNQARGTLRAMGDPAALAARKEELETVLARKRLELDALTAAMDALTQANTQLQERFSPELNRLAGDYMARLTGDQYSAVSLTRELEGFVRTGDGVLPRSALFLSRGTADQLYLAVRLAVCRLCLPERPPILLDDALAAFDDTRLGLALELLWELSGEQQLLLFTCQKREGEALDGVPGVTKIEL